jgi:hypothetical protein
VKRTRLFRQSCRVIRAQPCLASPGQVNAFLWLRYPLSIKNNVEQRVPCIRSRKAHVLRSVASQATPGEIAQVNAWRRS